VINTKFLFLLTEHGRYSELKYASCVARRIAEQIKAMGHEVIMIERPSPQDANDAVKRYKPDVIWWVGHGNPTTTTLENVRVWIKAPDYNTDILSDTIACALSCLTGRYLGKYVVESKGCMAYLGYTEEFWFPWCNDPKYFNCACSGENPYGVREELWEKIVECAHEANLYFVLGLAKGMNVEQATKYSLRRFDYWISYFESVRPKDDEERSVIKTVIWILKSNKDATVLYEKKPAPVRAPELKMAVGIPMALVALGSLVSYLGARGGD